MNHTIDFIQISSVSYQHPFYCSKIQSVISHCTQWSCLHNLLLHVTVSSFFFFLILYPSHYSMIITQIFCRKFLNFGLSDISALLDLRYEFWGGMQRGVMPFSLHPRKYYRFPYLNWLILPQSLGLEVSAKYLHCNITSLQHFPLSILHSLSHSLSHSFKIIVMTELLQA